MTYLVQAAIADSQMMMARVAQCAAEQDAPGDPDRWAYDRRRVWAAAPDWDAAWAYALNVHSEEADYSPGADEAVITDSMILGQVQTMLSGS